MPKGILEGDLTARTEVKVRIRGGKDSGRFKTEISYDPCYYENEDGTITCGLGAILFLTKNNPFVAISFASIQPDRAMLVRIEIPQGVLNHPKWLVNSKERWYFYEALEACRKKHCGTVKLPTGSGKTVIELVLAYNQLQEIGTGIILVPTNTIKDQFVRSAKEFGIPLIDYRGWLGDSDHSPKIVISLPTVVYNDILEIRKLVLHKHRVITWIIADECHHTAAKTWNTIFLGLPNLTRSHGFSALPVKSSSQLALNFAGMSIEDAMTISIVGPVIYEKSTKELKDFLNIPRLINLYYTWPKDRWSDQKTDDWHKLKALQYKNVERLSLIANVIRLLIDREYNTIIHVGEKGLGIELLRLVDNEKCVAWYGGGEVKGQDINVETIRRSAGKEILALICTSHAIEGLDLDTPLNAVVLIEGKDPRQALQKCGRITRPDRRPSIIINLMDQGLWILPRHSEQRRDTIQREFDSDLYNATSLDQLALTLDMMKHEKDNTNKLCETE
jgi:superfamily II DNA or RNA helicase